MTMHTEVEYADARYHGINRACTGRLLSLLKAHHDYAVRVPKDHIKPERLVVEISAEPTPEFKELWFGVVSETPIESRVPSIERIQRTVCKHYKAERNDLISPRRTADIVRPRQIAMYLAKKLTLRSLPDIGRRFGGRDHSTVLHAVRKIESRIVTDAKTATEVALLRSLLEPVMEAAE